MRRYLITSCLVLAVFTLILATQAKADSIDNFTYQAGGNTFTWQLPSSPTISADNLLPGINFGFTDIAYSENDIPQDPAALSFFSLNLGGGLRLGDFIQNIFSISASDFQVYGGSEDAPTFLTRSEEHTSELQSQSNLVCRLLLEKKDTPTILTERQTSNKTPITARPPHDAATRSSTTRPPPRNTTSETP